MLTKKSRIALTTVIWWTLGAGLFGVPYVFAYAWVLQWTIRTVVIWTVAIILNLLQAEVTLTMPDRMRLPGMMQRLLPKRLSLIGLLTASMQYFIAIFAYISLSGIFINILLWSETIIHPSISASIYALLVWLLIYKGVDWIEKYDKLIVVVFLCTLTFLILYGFSITTPSHFLLWEKASWFLPYWVLIYALNSASSVPVLEDILGKEKKDLPYIIVIWWVFCMTMVLLRWWAVVGISGIATTTDALSGLQNFLPSRIVKLSWLVGILAISSPHLVLWENLFETLKQNFRLSSLNAWTVVTVLPLIAYLYLQSDFVSTIWFSGAVFTGLTCVFIWMMNIILHKKYWKKSSHVLPYNKELSYIIIGIFSFGIVYEILKEFFL